MLGERKPHYKDHMWEGCEEFIDAMLEDKEPLEEFDEALNELSDESENEDTDSDVEGESGEDDKNEEWETDEEEAQESDVEKEGDMVASALSWLKVECGPGGDFDAENQQTRAKTLGRYHLGVNIVSYIERSQNHSDRFRLLGGYSICVR